MEKNIELKELRIKIDQLNEKIISGLKSRSRYLLNQGVFNKKFLDNLTWFEYRLRAEQSIDSEFGRYLYPDQAPLLFKKEDLAKAKISRNPVQLRGLKDLDIDASNELIAAYKKVLTAICEKGEDVNTYGEVAKLDVENVLTLTERSIGLGKQVAEYKFMHSPKIIDCKSDAEIKKFLLTAEREKEIVKEGIAYATRLNIKNPEAVGVFMQELINITRDVVEIKYIKHAQVERK